MGRAVRRRTCAEARARVGAPREHAGVRSSGAPLVPGSASPRGRDERARRRSRDRGRLVGGMADLRHGPTERAVRRAIDYIRAGDVFQVNLAHRLSTPWRGDPLALYARLRQTSPAPFMALTRLGGVDVVSASPERFLRRRGDVIESRPIKGT